MKHASPRFKYVKLGEDRRSLEISLANRLIYSMGKDPVSATTRDWFNTTAYVVRERLVERWIETMRAYRRADAKRVYYLSLEFLTGRLLLNSLLNLGFYDQCRDALATLGIELDEILELEEDAGLGNGGLGRLAACFLDSLASLSLPGYGYGIRYEYGMFWQRIEHGCQIETPDNWLRYGNPWEFPRPEVLFPVRFGGRTVEIDDGKGCLDTQRARSTIFACGPRRRRASSICSISTKEITSRPSNRRMRPRRFRRCSTQTTPPKWDVSCG
jgi:starch phosphorylase